MKSKFFVRNVGLGFRIHVELIYPEMTIGLDKKLNKIHIYKFAAFDVCVCFRLDLLVFKRKLSYW